MAKSGILYALLCQNMVAHNSNTIDVFGHMSTTCSTGNFIADREVAKNEDQLRQDEARTSQERAFEFETEQSRNIVKCSSPIVSQSKRLPFAKKQFDEIVLYDNLVADRLSSLGLKCVFDKADCTIALSGDCATSLDLGAKLLTQWIHMENNLGLHPVQVSDKHGQTKSRSALGLEELARATSEVSTSSSKIDRLTSIYGPVPTKSWADDGLNTHTHAPLFSRSSLPFEVGHGTPPPTQWSSQEPTRKTLAPGLGGSHLPITRTVSDSYSQQKRQFTALCSSRRKLESEDSSYDSDHEAHDHQQNSSIILKAPSVQISKSHDDVSRTPSETLGVEFAEHVNLYQGPPRSREPSPGQPQVVVVNHDANEDQDRLERIINDPSYNSKVEYALRLGYSESLLQKALVKLGLDAQLNQLLEELIRLQTSKPSFGEDTNDGNHKSMGREDSLVGLSGGKSFLYTAEEDLLLPIVIDGSNVAMSHGNKDVYSCLGIRICVNWFQARGHKDITVFVPKWRKETSRPDTPITDQQVLLDLEKERLLAFTPSRQVSGKRYVCHDDRYILNLAAETGAVVVSNDNYRDLINEKPEFKKVVEEKILMYSFVNDRFMPPDDPLGRNGPTLDLFLKRKPTYGDLQRCPYGKKCTYGNKCKFFHAERGNQPQKSITDKLKEHSSQKINEVRARTHSRDSSPGDPLLTRTRSMLPLRTDTGGYMLAHEKQALCRTRSTMPRLSINHGHDVVSKQPQVLAPTQSQQTCAQAHIPPNQPPFWHNSSHCAIQQTVSLGPNMMQMFHGSDPNRSFSYENVAAEQEKGQSHWTTNPMKYPTYNMPDTSMPPPPPRGPWNQSSSSAQGLRGEESQMELTNNSHRKLARQLTLNPLNDPRIRHHQHHQPPPTPPTIPFPPPTCLPPPTYSSTNTLPPSLHATVTRNASAPEQSFVKNMHEQNPGGLTLTPSPMGEGGSSLQHGGHTRLQRNNSTSDSQLHKTLSESYNELTWKPLEKGSNLTTNANMAVSPLIGSSDGVWEASSMTTKSNASGDADTARSKLYYHLAQLFPEDQVIMAMSALPEETNVQKICAYILFNNNKKPS